MMGWKLGMGCCCVCSYCCPITIDNFTDDRIVVVSGFSDWVCSYVAPIPVGAGSLRFRFSALNGAHAVPHLFGSPSGCGPVHYLARLEVPLAIEVQSPLHPFIAGCDVGTNMYARVYDLWLTARLCDGEQTTVIKLELSDLNTSLEDYPHFNCALGELGYCGEKFVDDFFPDVDMTQESVNCCQTWTVTSRGAQASGAAIEWQCP